MTDTPYLDKPEQWEAIIKHAKAVGIIGFDTETYGHDVKESSPAFRASIHVWSLSFYTGEMSPRGYALARGCTLPAAGLEAFKDVMGSRDITKVAHNAHHDQHALANHSIKLRGVVDTLDLVRLAYPERSLDMTKGFRLKPLARDLLGKPKRDEYNDIVNDVLLESKWHYKKVCLCGEPGCKKRALPTHTKLNEPYETVKERKVTYPLETIIPGHKQWARLVPYAATDAVDALELRSLALKKLEWSSRNLPELSW